MQLLNDIHHLMFVTSDMDRLIAFYERVFGARTTVDLREEGVRHAFIEVGPHTVLHPFQVPGIEPPGPLPFFQRGRLDHRIGAADGFSDSVGDDVGEKRCDATKVLEQERSFARCPDSPCRRYCR